MKTNLATLLLVFAFHGAAAHSIRGIEDHTPHRTLKERRSKKDKDNEAYRVIEGKVKHSKDYSNTIRFDEDPPVLWLVVKKGDEKTGRCVSEIGEWLLEEYNMDLAVIEKNPKDRVHDDDIVVFIDSKPSSSECSEIAEDIADVPEVNERRRGGMFDSGEQNLAYFDVEPEDDCDKKCKKKKKECEKDVDDEEDEDALKECDDEEKDCKDECEDKCEKDCKDNWGIFEDACKRAC